MTDETNDKLSEVYVPSIPEKIRAAVVEFDQTNDDQWTAAGLPDVAHMRTLTGDKSITRADISAALPNFARTVLGDADDGPEEPAQSAAPTPEGAEANEAQGAAPSKPEGTEKDAAAGPAVADEDAGASRRLNMDDSETAQEPEWDVQAQLVRGLLMAAIMRLSQPQRALGERLMLEDMWKFVNGFDPSLHLAVFEMIRSVVETKPNEIAPGQYKDRVLAAMEIVTGKTLGNVNPGIPYAEDQAAAARRLAAITGADDDERAAREAAHALKDGTDEQNAAHARLYGEASTE